VPSQVRDDIAKRFTVGAQTIIRRDDPSCCSWPVNRPSSTAWSHACCCPSLLARIVSVRAITSARSRVADEVGDTIGQFIDIEVALERLLDQVLDVFAGRVADTLDGLSGVIVDPF
jgi:hypothetical protein